MTPEPQPSSAPVASPPMGEEPVDVRLYWAILLKRKWVVALALVAVVAAAALYTLRQPRVYSASASLVIELEAPEVLGDGVRQPVDMGVGWYSQSTKEFFETQFKIIRSRQLAERVAEQLGLGRDQQFLGLQKPPEEQDHAMWTREAAAVLQSRLFVEPVKDSHVVNVRFEDADPDRAAAVANAFTRAYMELNLERHTEGSKDASSWLNSQLVDLRGKVERSEAALHQFKRDNDLVHTSYENHQTMNNQSLLALNDSLVRLRTRRAELEARQADIDEARKSGELDRILALSQVASSPFINQLKMAYVAQESEARDLRERYGESHPKMKAAEEQVAGAKASLLKEVDTLLGAQASELRQAQATEKKLEGLLAQVKQDAFRVGQKETDYQRLAREKETNVRLLDAVLKRVKEIDLSAALKVNNVRILDAAERSPWPVRPNVKRTLSLACLLGLMLGVALAFGLEWLDRSIKTEEDIESLGLTFLGILPHIEVGDEGNLEEAGRRDLYVKGAPQSIVAECCRTIRTNLLFLNPDAPWKKLLVTSTGTSEGKTTALVSLAVTLAQGGNRVLVVDSDMRRGRMHKTFGVPNGEGLSTVIANGSDPDGAIKSTDVPGLFVLPSGPVPPNPAELLHSEKFKALLDALGQKYDRILFDSPPVGPVADPLILANQMDGTLLVARLFKTDRDLAERTVRVLKDAGAKMLGTVLNGVGEKKHGRYLRYYIRYYHRYYGSSQGPA